MRPRGGGGSRRAAPRSTGTPAARGSLAGLRGRLTDLIEPVTRQAGFDLERVSVTRLGRRYRVQVVVDSDDGLGLDAIAEVSRAVSAALDAADDTGEVVIPGEYVLEVSSPGVDRPLTEPRHWRRNIGRLVTVPGPAGQPLTGRITSVTGQAVLLQTDDGPRELAYEQLGPGRVQVELHPAAERDEPVSGLDAGEDDGEDEAR